jgi:hypothetical protein
MRLTGQYWPGVIVGIGIGLMLGPALVETQLLTPSHRVWAFVLGLTVFGIGNGLSSHVRRREAATTTNQTWRASGERAGRSVRPAPPPRLITDPPGRMSGDELVCGGRIGVAFFPPILPGRRPAAGSGPLRSLRTSEKPRPT